MYTSLKFIARRYRVFHDLLHIVRFLGSAGYRNDYHRLKQELKQWRKTNGKIMDFPLGKSHRGNVVFLGWAKFEHVLCESVVRKAFEIADYSVKVLVDPTPATREVYQSLGVPRIDSYTKYFPIPNKNEAKRLLEHIEDDQSLVEYCFDGVSIGKYVCSTLMRRTRQGSISLKDPTLRYHLIEGLANSMAAVRGARRLIDDLSPKAIVLVDRGYTPYGEMFDTFVNARLQVITWNIAHRNNTIMLKRYHKDNRLEHPSSLSQISWEKICTIPWKDDIKHQLYDELKNAYNSGEWYGEVGTQFGKSPWEKEAIVKKYGLNPNKKTAVIYSHIFWDATFFWGEDLFKDYEDWFVQTVKAACDNDRLNWLIKVHPANLVKNRRDGVDAEPSEILTLRKKIGLLPKHVKIIPADSPITTLSLFSATNYCLTVRGTVGIEAALFGKTVLTAGTGRYDRHGFTLDFEKKTDYLECIGKLETIPEADSKMIRRAMRFGYGIFLCRPVRLKVFNLQFEQDANATLRADLRAKTVKELKESPELINISNWLDNGDDDLLSFPS